jgi:Zn-dependent protease with chaperone function
VTAVASGPSLRNRALLAIALTVTFYLLAVAIALGLIVAPIAVWEVSHHGNIWIAIAMIGAGVAILRAIVPPRDEYEPPGPELRPADHPKLHSLLREVAQNVGEVPADSVYVDLDLNASVLEHKGSRIMVLGLPLLATLSPDELRAVIAHEYGHYAGGDTRYAGWIWRTRHAVLQAVVALATSDSSFRRNVVRWPFQWYAELFLRITNAISRRQEFAADQLSARAASPETAGSALRRLQALSPLYDGYLHGDLIPMLEAEKRPPIAAGFAAAAAHSNVAPALDEVVKTDIEAQEEDPYASHPTLRERLAALGVPIEPSAPPPASTTGTDLLQDVASLERLLLVEYVGEEAAGFPPVDWTEADAVHGDRLRELAESYGTIFPADLTIGSAGNAARELTNRREALRHELPPDESDMPLEIVDNLALNVLSSLVATAAVSAGAQIVAPPGQPCLVVYDGNSLDPWATLGPIAFEAVDVASWAAEPVVQALGNESLRAAGPPR